MRNIVASLTLLFVASACSSPPAHAPAESGGGDGPAVGGPAEDAGAENGVKPPDTAAGRALTWILAAINGKTPTVADVNARFAPTFLQAVAPADLVTILSQLADSKPWTLQGFDGDASRSRSSPS